MRDQIISSLSSLWKYCAIRISLIVYSVGRKWAKIYVQCINGRALNVIDLIFLPNFLIQWIQFFVVKIHHNWPLKLVQTKLNLKARIEPFLTDWFNEYYFSDAMNVIRFLLEI